MCIDDETWDAMQPWDGKADDDWIAGHEFGADPRPGYALVVSSSGFNLGALSPTLRLSGIGLLSVQWMRVHPDLVSGIESTLPASRRGWYRKLPMFAQPDTAAIDSHEERVMRELSGSMGLDVLPDGSVDVGLDPADAHRELMRVTGADRSCWSTSDGETTLSLDVDVSRSDTDVIAEARRFHSNVEVTERLHLRSCQLNQITYRLAVAMGYADKGGRVDIVSMDRLVDDVIECIDEVRQS